MIKNLINKFNINTLITIIFNRKNFTKVFIIFTVGFASRALLSSYYNINVYIDYLNIISVVYYIIMSCFVVIINHIIDYFDINIIPEFFSEIATIIYKSFALILKNLNWNTLKNIKRDDFRISSLKRFFNSMEFQKDNNKLYHTVECLDEDAKQDIVKSDDIKIDYTNQKNGDGSHKGHRSKESGHSSREHGHSRGERRHRDVQRTNSPNNYTESNEIYTHDNTTSVSRDRLFIIEDDTRYSHTDVGSINSYAQEGNRNFYTQESNSGYNNAPTAPVISKLSTPSTMSPLFNTDGSQRMSGSQRIPSDFSQTAPLFLQPNRYSGNNFSTPSTMSPLFPQSQSSFPNYPDQDQSSRANPHWNNSSFVSRTTPSTTYTNDYQVEDTNQNPSSRPIPHWNNSSFVSRTTPSTTYTTNYQDQVRSTYPEESSRASAALPHWNNSSFVSRTTPSTTYTDIYNASPNVTNNHLVRENMDPNSYLNVIDRASNALASTEQTNTNSVDWSARRNIVRDEIRRHEDETLTRQDFIEETSRNMVDDEANKFSSKLRSSWESAKEDLKESRRRSWEDKQKALREDAEIVTNTRRQRELTGKKRIERINERNTKHRRK